MTLSRQPRAQTARPETRPTHASQRLVMRYGLGRPRSHDLRHTDASLLLGEGVPMHVVQSYCKSSLIDTQERSSAW